MGEGELPLPAHRRGSGLHLPLDLLPLYHFDIHSGTWKHHAFIPPTGTARRAGPDLPRLFDEYLAEARRLVESTGGRVTDADLKTTEKDLIPFVYV